MGHAHVQTPNLDQLASEGLIYERGYANKCCQEMTVAG